MASHRDESVPLSSPSGIGPSCKGSALLAPPNLGSGFAPPVACPAHRIAEASRNEPVSGKSGGTAWGLPKGVPKRSWFAAYRLGVLERSGDGTTSFLCRGAGPWAALAEGEQSVPDARRVEREKGAPRTRPSGCDGPVRSAWRDLDGAFRGCDPHPRPVPSQLWGPRRSAPKNNGRKQRRKASSVGMRASNLACLRPRRAVRSPRRPSS